MMEIELEKGQDKDYETMWVEIRNQYGLRLTFADGWEVTGRWRVGGGGAGYWKNEKYGKQ